MRVEANCAEGRPEGWHKTFEASDPEVLAVIALSTALRAGPVGESTPRIGQTILGYSRRVVAAIRDQEDYEAFEDAQKEAKRAALAPLKAELAKAKRGSDAAKQMELAKEIGECRADRLSSLFRRNHPTASRHQWARFASQHSLERKAYKVLRARQMEDEVVMAAVGGALAKALAEGAPKWFEVTRSGDGPVSAQSNCLLLTEHATEAMKDADLRAEVARPAMKPMICPPRPWVYREKEAA